MAQRARAAIEELHCPKLAARFRRALVQRLFP
jgi:hypothetical protein